jgi:hypothetical protein
MRFAPTINADKKFCDELNFRCSVDTDQNEEGAFYEALGGAWWQQPTSSRERF